MTTKQIRKYVNIGGYMCLPDSERIDIGETIIFTNDARQTVFAYKRGHKTPVDTFFSEDWSDYRVKVSALIEAAELAQKSKLAAKTSHSLRKGEVLVCHTDIKNPGKDKVRFFQIEDIHAGGEVSYFEILSEEIAFTGCKQSIPLVGMKVGALKKSVVLVDTITTEEGLIGKKLPYYAINLDGLEIKYYEPQYHSLLS